MSFSDTPSEPPSHPTGIDKTGLYDNSAPLTQQAFDKLMNRFSSDREKAGLEYETTRRKLLRFFWSRSVDSADACADETINRVARRIDEGQSIDNLPNYFYGVARLVFMETLKAKERTAVALDDSIQIVSLKTPEPVEPDTRLLCLDRCMESLSPESRLLILEYYEGEGRLKIERRQQLADRLRIPLNALRIRAYRIRLILEQCMRACLQEYAGQK